MNEDGIKIFIQKMYIIQYCYKFIVFDIQLLLKDNNKYKEYQCFTLKCREQ